MFLISLSASYFPDKCELSRKWEKQYHESEAAEIDLLLGIKKNLKSRICICLKRQILRKLFQYLLDF